MAQLQFSGFCPTSEIKELVKQRLAQVLDESPSDASAMLELVMKAGGRIEGLLKVHALAGAFVAQTMKADPRAAIESLVADVRAQVGRWKQLRILP